MDNEENLLERIRLLMPRLKRAGIYFEEGLSSSEFEKFEQVCEITFPPDLRYFLSLGIPRGYRKLFGGIEERNFHDWRTDPKALLEWNDNWIWTGIQVDLVWWHDNELWPSAWGERPDTLRELEAAMYARYVQAPKLIPVYGHRFMPSEPNLVGNPVYSVMQTDIIMLCKKSR